MGRAATDGLVLRRLVADCGVGQAVGLGVILAADMRDGEFDGASQLAADKIEGIEASAAAPILAFHLPDHDL